MPKRKDYPRLPDACHAPGGVVLIEQVPDLRDDDGKAAFGVYDPDTRLVRVDRSITARQKWWTYYHEWTHVALNDSGLDQIITDDAAEALCNALATARMRERFG